MEVRNVPMQSSTDIQLGQEVPDFEIEIFDPVKRSLGKMKLSEIRSRDRWTILFFYPADFTFV